MIVIYVRIKVEKNLNVLFPNLLSLVLIFHIDGLVQERRNSIANALELRLSCPNPSIWNLAYDIYLSTHRGLVKHICVNELYHHGFR